jgi:hypothetical protein
MTQLKRKVSIRFHMTRGFEKSSLQKVNQISDSLEEIVNRRLEKTRNYTSRLSDKVSNGPGFDPSLRNFTESFYNRIQNRFIKNPRNWPPLSKTTRKIRSFLLNPEDLSYDILKWWNAGQKKGKISAKPELSFRRPKLDPRMVERRPSLLRTGSLKRSVRVRLGKKNSKSKIGRGWRFVHLREINLDVVGSPYHKIQFFGGTSTAYTLNKNFKTHDGKNINIHIPIPNEFYPEIRLKMGELKIGGYELQREIISIPPRNPLYFDKKDISDLNEILNRFILDTKSGLKGALNAK